MSARAQTLAERFERANDDLIALTERCSPAGWRAICPDEHWSVGVTTHHIADGHTLIVDFVRAIATGQPQPAALSSMAALEQFNARHAAEEAGCTREETVELLRRNGAFATEFIRGLGDDLLDHASPVPILGGAMCSAQRMVEDVLIGHIASHLDSIRAALDHSASDA